MLAPLLGVMNTRGTLPFRPRGVSAEASGAGCAEARRRTISAVRDGHVPAPPWGTRGSERPRRSRNRGLCGPPPSSRLVCPGVCPLDGGSVSAEYAGHRRCHRCRLGPGCSPEARSTTLSDATRALSGGRSRNGLVDRPSGPTARTPHSRRHRHPVRHLPS
jgi:hypothetical protein